MLLNLSSDEKRNLINEIQNFFDEERGEEIGIIAAEEVLEFFMDNLGGKIYNKALDDARIWTKKRLEDIDIDYNMLYKSVD